MFSMLLSMIAFLIFFGSLVWLIICLVNKYPKEKMGIAITICCLLFIVGLSILSEITSPTNDKNITQQTEQVVTLTVSHKELLKKTYADFDESQRTKFAEIEVIYDELSDSNKQPIKSDFERLSKERDIQIAQITGQEVAAVEAQKVYQNNIDILVHATTLNQTEATQVLHDLKSVGISVIDVCDESVGDGVDTLKSFYVYTSDYMYGGVLLSIKKRKTYYIGVAGNDLYDSSKGGIVHHLSDFNEEDFYDNETWWGE